MSLGERLREERERLGLSQPKFAALADTTKQTLFSWEVGKTAPDGFQLAAIAAAGADIQYIVTGERSDMALTPDERELLALYRASSLTGKMAAVGALQGVLGATLAPKVKKQTQNIHGGVGQVVKVGGDMNQPGVTFNVGEKKKK